MGPAVGWRRSGWDFIVGTVIRDRGTMWWRGQLPGTFLLGWLASLLVFFRLLEIQLQITKYANLATTLQETCQQFRNWDNVRNAHGIVIFTQLLKMQFIVIGSKYSKAFEDAHRCSHYPIASPLVLMIILIYGYPDINMIAAQTST
jgi:hypothetical protein